MTENIILFERNGLTGETVETVLTGADAEAWRAERRGADEELLADLRSTRDRLLAETDWVTLKAIDDSNDGLGIQLPQVWMDYRQALRDLPANTTDPANPVWPTKPEVN
jgi:hypothetical protein